MNDILQVLFLFITFLGVLALSYVVTRKIGSYNKKTFRNKKMQVIEVLSLNQGNYVYLVKAEDEYVLLGSSKQGVNYITSIDIKEKDIRDNIKDNTGEIGETGFHKELIKLMKGKIGNE